MSSTVLPSSLPLFESLDLENKRTLLLLDLDMPVQNGQINDFSKLEAALPTINKCLEKGAKLIIASHVGKPKASEEIHFSLEAAASKLAEVLNTEIIFTETPAGEAVGELSKTLRKGQIMVLENLLYNPGEEQNSENFAKELQNLCDVFINDAFALIHQNFASNFLLPQKISQKAVGYQLKQALEHLEKLKNPEDKPYLAIIGGVKLSDKLSLINSLLKKADQIILGGSVAYTFMGALGKPVGASRCEPALFNSALELLDRAAAFKTEIILPHDHQVVSTLEKPESMRTSNSFSQGDIGVDIGPQSLQAFSQLIGQAGTVFWNGPLGICEYPEYAQGTLAVARKLKQQAAYKVLVGADTLKAIRQGDLLASFNWSTSAGPSALKFLEGSELGPLKVFQKY